jgi:hypothetical protein
MRKIMLPNPTSLTRPLNLRPQNPKTKSWASAWPSGSRDVRVPHRVARMKLLRERDTFSPQKCPAAPPLARGFYHQWYAL